MKISRRFALFCLVLTLVGLAGSAQAGKVERTFNGKVVLSTKPFPMRFKNDRAMIKSLKKLRTFKLMHNEEGFVDVEFMAFFKKPQTATEFTATVFDVTEDRKMIESYPIYPSQRKTTILASGARLKKAQFAPDRSYHLTVTKTFGGTVLADVKFVIVKNPAVPDEPEAAAPAP